jgi:hypothetical protein
MVRTDLSPAQQIVQASHAAYEAGLHGQAGGDIKSLVLCACDSEQELEKAQEYLKRHDIPHVLFREPDIGNQATALATLPVNAAQRKRLSRWPLWR